MSELNDRLLTDKEQDNAVIKIWGVLQGDYNNDFMSDITKRFVSYDALCSAQDTKTAAHYESIIPQRIKEAREQAFSDIENHPILKYAIGTNGLKPSCARDVCDKDKDCKLSKGCHYWNWQQLKESKGL